MKKYDTKKSCLQYVAGLLLTINCKPEKILLPARIVSQSAADG